MKKYKLILFVLAFILGSFNIYANSVSAANCASGDLFNTATGQACATTSTVVACPTGNLFSATTGQRCTTWQDNLSDDVVQFNSLFQTWFKVGVNNDSVKPLQQFLKDQGYYFGKIDGKYGKISARAVKDFQDDNNIFVAVNTPPTANNNPPQQQTPPSTPPSTQSVGFISPTQGSTWTLGNSMSIKIKTSPQWSHCSNGFYLYNSRSQEIGTVGILTEPGKTVYNWPDVSKRYATCGTGVGEIPISVSVGTYKICLKEQNTETGIGNNFYCSGLFTINNPISQQPPQQPSTVNSFFVVNADSGVNVSNPTFVVNGNTYSSINTFLAYMHTLSNGLYNVNISASGYQNMTGARISVPGNLSSMVINLDPVTHVHNCPHQPSNTNAFALCGYLVDENHNALAGVQVSSPTFSSISATTASDGYYDTQFLPLQNYDCGNPVTFTYSKLGYKTLNYILNGPYIYIGGDMGTQLLMKHGSGSEQKTDKHGMCP